MKNELPPGVEMLFKRLPPATSEILRLFTILQQPFSCCFNTVSCKRFTICFDFCKLTPRFPLWYSRRTVQSCPLWISTFKNGQKNLRLRPLSAHPQRVSLLKDSTALDQTL